MAWRHVIHERMFAVEVSARGAAAIRGSRSARKSELCAPFRSSARSRDYAGTAAWLNENGLHPFLDEVRGDRLGGSRKNPASTLRLR